MSDSDALAESELVTKLMAGEVVDTILQTDQRVISRITDGIYRQPSSALRELVANAYDADATRVIIQTDAPRFSEIRIRDNGVGMGAEALIHVIHSIGGSTKRTQLGKTFGTTNSQNPNLSPKGRKLIGKIGIGLFSVAQLTRQFRIITKQAEESYRLVADVILYTYSDEYLEQIGSEDDGKFQAGTVQLWQVPADDIDGHGTEVVIRDILPRIREQLRSKGRWDLVQSSENDGEHKVHPPIFHVGKVDLETGETLVESAYFPWENDDSPEERFRKLVDAVLDRFEPGRLPRNPRLDLIFDNYFQTIWNLSLSIPLSYIDKHPFDVDKSDGIKILQISNSTSGQASEVNLQNNQTVRDTLNLRAPEILPNDSFSVLIDGIELFRPQPFLRMPRTTQAVPFPIMAVGEYREEFSDYAITLSGGGLEFEAYLVWTHVVAPIENRGVLIRIHDASGTLFDPNFLQYQGGEGTRSAQTTAEIFVLKGLESALNIDRESFNYAHPHFQIIAKWLHSAMRQLYNRQKMLQREYREERRQQAYHAELSDVEQKGAEILSRAYEQFGTSSSSIGFVIDGMLEDGEVEPDAIVVEIKTNTNQDPIQIQRKKFLMKILAAYSLLDLLSADDIQNLYNDIEAIFD